MFSPQKKFRNPPSPQVAAWGMKMFQLFGSNDCVGKQGLAGSVVLVLGTAAGVGTKCTAPTWACAQKATLYGHDCALIAVSHQRWMLFWSLSWPLWVPLVQLIDEFIRYIAID